MPLTWSLTNPTQSSTNACVFDGTPEVALRVTHHMNPSPMKPSTIDVTTVSVLMLQKLVSPTCLTMKVRWWLMYSVGDS